MKFNEMHVSQDVEIYTVPDGGGCPRWYRGKIVNLGERCMGPYWSAYTGRWEKVITVEFRESEHAPIRVMDVRHGSACDIIRPIAPPKPTHKYKTGDGLEVLMEGRWHVCKVHCLMSYPREDAVYCVKLIAAPQMVHETVESKLRGPSLYQSMIDREMERIREVCFVRFAEYPVIQVADLIPKAPPSSTFIGDGGSGWTRAYAESAQIERARADKAEAELKKCRADLDVALLDKANLDACAMARSKIEARLVEDERRHRDVANRAVDKYREASVLLDVVNNRADKAEAHVAKLQQRLDKIIQATRT